MAKRKQVVRVVLSDGINGASVTIRRLLEQFRYAGLVTVHRDDENGVCFDLHCPHGLVNEVWARQNAARMQSFMYNAVVAPECSRPEPNQKEGA